jgi:hypothetical protein
MKQMRSGWQTDLLHAEDNISRNEIRRILTQSRLPLPD